MQALSKTWFISDLHLDAEHPEITRQFIKLLQSCDQSINTIYILGDLFEAWVGDDTQSGFLDEITRQLRETSSRGTSIFFMHGNRDFLIGQQFLTQTGCQLLSEEEKISLYGNSVLLMHGDTLCTNDKQYLRARSLMRNRLIQKIFLLLPLKFRLRIAAGARQASHDYTSKTDTSIMDVTQQAVANVMQKHHADILIHGHTHRPGTHNFFLENQEKCRIVLPAWHNGGYVYEWRSDGSRELIKLD